MSFAEQCVLIEQHNRASVMAATFGHLEAEPGTRHPGWFTFIHGQHGNMVVIESDFPSFGEGPGYFEDRQEFIWSKVRDNGVCSAVGIYRFEGEYRRYKKGGGASLGYFVGRITKHNVNKGAR